ncbi:hypothetical protein WMY93_011536 [Mugilogobius chulae]|uniref:Uncharacterized protein n=1 Tax=Mugilogobius chulae TaxID=88201 RepID=A0AAW0P338_9GOBI
MRKLAQESCRRMESEAITVTCSVLAKESETLKKHLQKLTKEYDEEKARQYENTKKVANVERLKLVNKYQLEEIDLKEKELIELKAKSESYKHIRKDEEDLEIQNQKLSKKMKQLEKDVQKLQQSEQEIQKVNDQKSELRKENCSLHKQVLTLESYIGKKNLLKAHLKTQKSEEASLKQRQAKLKMAISDLDVVGKTGIVNW